MLASNKSNVGLAESAGANDNKRIPMGALPQPAAGKWKIARSFPRFALSRAVIVFSSRITEQLSGRMADIGLGGLCVLLPKTSLGPNERVYVEFRLAIGAEPMRVGAKLCYIAGDRHGFQFLNITPQQRDDIRRACQHLQIV